MPKKPLEGLRVADFSWYGAGPIAGNTLSQFGAEVIRVESETRPDGLRRVHPFAMNPDGTFKTGYNVSGYFKQLQHAQALHPAEPQRPERPGSRVPAH
jgi:crotonobetainyl-CoA:carnitine CoA-transferase CaiB-like acyl-CoA transferase